MKSNYLTPLTPEQRRDVDDLIKYTEANRRPLRKPRIRKRDPGMAPRPANCFLVYRKEKQAQIAELCTRANHRVISKIVAKWWKEIDATTKEIYINVAKQVKQDHLKKFPDYKYTPKRKAKGGGGHMTKTLLVEEENHFYLEPTSSTTLSALPCFEDLSQDFNSIMNPNKLSSSPSNYDNTELTNLLLSRPLEDSPFEPVTCPPWLPTYDSFMMPSSIEFLDPQWTTFMPDPYLYQPPLDNMTWGLDLSATPVSLPESDSPSSAWSEQYDLYPSLPLALS